MYTVISTFADLTDNRHLYNPGDTFPRQGLEVDAARIASLASGDNATGHPLITVKQPVEAAQTKPKEIVKPVRKAATKAVSRRNKG